MTTKAKIVDLGQLTRLTDQWKSDDLKVVFTNGCFDLLHPGHIDYLEKSSLLGDRLIVAVNANVSVKMLKGAERPIFDEQDRAKMIAALHFVDAVILFEENTPEAIVERVLPSVLVKGADYKISNIAGAEIVMRNGGKVELIELKPGFSTSSIIGKLKGLNG